MTAYLQSCNAICCVSAIISRSGMLVTIGASFFEERTCSVVECRILNGTLAAVLLWGKVLPTEAKPSPVARSRPIGLEPPATSGFDAARIRDGVAFGKRPVKPHHREKANLVRE